MLNSCRRCVGYSAYAKLSLDNEHRLKIEDWHNNAEYWHYHCCQSRSDGFQTSIRGGSLHRRLLAQWHHVVAMYILPRKCSVRTRIIRLQRCRLRTPNLFGFSHCQACVTCNMPVLRDYGSTHFWRLSKSNDIVIPTMYYLYMPSTLYHQE